MNLLSRLLNINDDLKKISGSEREKILEADYAELFRDYQSTKEKLNIDLENMRISNRLSVNKLEDLLKQID